MLLDASPILSLPAKNLNLANPTNLDSNNYAPTIPANPVNPDSDKKNSLHQAIELPFLGITPELVVLKKKTPCAWYMLKFG